MAVKGCCVVFKIPHLPPRKRQRTDGQRPVAVNYAQNCFKGLPLELREEIYRSIFNDLVAEPFHAYRVHPDNSRFQTYTSLRLLDRATAAEAKRVFEKSSSRMYGNDENLANEAVREDSEEFIGHQAGFEEDWLQNHLNIRSYRWTVRSENTRPPWRHVDNGIVTMYGKLKDICWEGYSVRTARRMLAYYLATEAPPRVAEKYHGLYPLSPLELMLYTDGRETDAWRALNPDPEHQD
ncbi:hypothetical protein AC578_6486 [Pseudocercospora eumusae]|uniref:Uncharacterized protein n=1 Tax=Pseudocercospora eumusae TaxID=321146 RepID=A0A139HCZ9_9PEZI|nr:hypothetical protein AC578_6486 [Pseudocercospora eumusae]